MNATGAIGAATAGFQTGFAAGAFLGQNLYRHLSGELRYAYLQSDLSLKSGGSSASFAGVAHVVHYDLILHTNRRGAGAALRGGGRRHEDLPRHGNRSGLPAARAVRLLHRNAGAQAHGRRGRRRALGHRPPRFMRAEFRDYITMFPKEIITPAPGVKYGSLLQDLVPMVGISYEF